MPRRGHQRRQILCDQTGRARCGSGTMQPNAGGSGFKRCHALRKQSRDGASQDIARAGSGEGGWRIVMDDHAALRGGDNAIRAFQHDNRAKPRCGGARGSKPIRARRAK